MGVFDLIVPAIIILVFVMKGLQRLSQILSQEADQGVANRKRFEATPEEVREFLRGLEGLRQKQAAPAARPQPARKPIERAPTARLPQRQTRPFWQESPAPTAATTLPRVSAETRKRRTRRKPAARSARAATARPPTAAPGSTQADLSPVALKGVGLKQAVIWSEILGPPVSRRGPRAHTPPLGRR